METRNLRKTRQGVVISNKMDKTIVIAAKFKEKHPIYGKFVQKTKKYHAHDEKNDQFTAVRDAAFRMLELATDILKNQT